MKISVRPDTCCGHARCQLLCPAVFGSDDAGYVALLLREVPPELEDDARQAALSCPENALAIED